VKPARAAHSSKFSPAAAALPGNGIFLKIASAVVDDNQLEFRWFSKLPFTSCARGRLSLRCFHRLGMKPGGKKFMAEGYCVKCKAKREIADGVEEVMKNGRKAIKGKCPTCGTVMFKILGGKATPPAAPAAPATPPATS
jgi:hypothetical protein